jgi:hypothetical protein
VLELAGGLFSFPVKLELEAGVCGTSHLDFALRTCEAFQARLSFRAGLVPSERWQKLRERSTWLLAAAFSYLSTLEGARRRSERH